MRLKETVVVTEIADEKMLIDANSDSKESFRGLVKLNETAAFIVDALKQDTTVEEIIGKVHSEYEGADENQIETDVKAIIEKLHSLKMITD